MKTVVVLVLTIAAYTASAGERFVSTIGTVQREIPADRLAMTLDVAATEKTIEASVVSLDRLLEEFSAQMATLNYPATAVSVKERKTEKAWEWQGEKRVLLGYSSSAHAVASRRREVVDEQSNQTAASIRGSAAPCLVSRSSRGSDSRYRPDRGLPHGRDASGPPLRPR